MAKVLYVDKKALSLVAQSWKRKLPVAQSSVLPATISRPSRVWENGGYGSLEPTLFLPVKEKVGEHFPHHFLLAKHISRLSLAGTVSSLQILYISNNEMELGLAPRPVIEKCSSQLESVDVSMNTQLSVSTSFSNLERRQIKLLKDESWLPCVIVVCPLSSRGDAQGYFRCPWIGHNLPFSLGHQIWDRKEQRAHFPLKTEHANKIEDKASNEVACCGVCKGAARCQSGVNDSRQSRPKSVEVADWIKIIVQAENPAIMKMLESAISREHLISMLWANLSMLIEENTELKAILAQKCDKIKVLNTPKVDTERPVNVVRPLPRRENINTMSQQRPAARFIPPEDEELMCPACKQRKRDCTICDEGGSRCTGCYQCASNAFPNCPFCDEEHTVTNIIRFLRMDNAVVWR